MNPSPTPQQLPPQAVLMQMLTARWTAHAIGLAARLGIADLVAAGPKCAEELGARTGMNPDALYRVLRALASVGIFAEEGAEESSGKGRGKFRLTPLAEPLRSSVPGSLRGAAMMFGAAEWQMRPWNDLAYAVRTGEPAFLHVFGMGLFEYFVHHPEEGKIFDDCMTGFSAMSNGAIAAAYDFSNVGTLVDVGGGHGGLLITILRANPKLRGVLFDSPSVVQGAKAALIEAGVADRATTEGGDFLVSVPDGADAYLMKHIVHGLADEPAAQLLEKCRRAMKPGGRVLVVEHVVAPGNDPGMSKLLDLEMLVMTAGGRERREAEFRKLFEAAGLRLARIVPTASPVSIVEGVAR